MDPPPGRPRRPAASMARRMSAESPTYDLTLLLDPEIEEARREKIVVDVEALIEQHAELIGRHDWGTRKTAFDVRKRGDVDYRLIQFHATNPLLESLDHALKITDGVLRFRIVKLRPGTPPPSDTPPPVAVGGGSDDDRDDRDDRGRGRGRDRDRDDRD